MSIRMRAPTLLACAALLVLAGCSDDGAEVDPARIALANDAATEVELLSTQLADSWDCARSPAATFDDCPGFSGASTRAIDLGTELRLAAEKGEGPAACDTAMHALSSGLFTWHDSVNAWRNGQAPAPAETSLDPIRDQMAAVITTCIVP